MIDYQVLKTALAQQEYVGLTDAQAATALNADDPTNPVLDKLQPNDIFSVLSDASQANLWANSAFMTLVYSLDSPENRKPIEWAVRIARKANAITAAERDAIVARINQTVPGPSKAVQLFGQRVTRFDVETARGLR